METVEYKNISFTVWDVGGQDKVLRAEDTLLLLLCLPYSLPPLKTGQSQPDLPLLRADSTPMETLFPEHTRADLCGG